jgi:splicing factor U2AF subunit
MAQQNAAANPQVTRQARRLYIGNMPAGMGLTETMLMEFFTATVSSLGIQTPGPVVSVWVSSEGTFGFVEFRAIQDCTHCVILLQGIALGGRILKVGRPADYLPPPQYLENYIVGMSPDQYKPPDTQANALSAMAAMGIAGLSGFGMPGMAGGSMLELEAALMAASGAAAGASPSVEESPTNVLLLLNMVQASELADDEDFPDLCLDVREECEKFGVVTQVVIPRPLEEGKPNEGQVAGTPDLGPRTDDVASHGRIFVKFAEVEHCAAAKKELDGRMFNHNRVGATYYEQSKVDFGVFF